MIWGCIAIIISAINVHIYIEILDKFLIPLTENWFGDEEVIFQDDNLSCHRAKGIKDFHQERNRKSLARPMKSSDLNLTEHL